MKMPLSGDTRFQVQISSSASKVKHKCSSHSLKFLYVIAFCSVNSLVLLFCNKYVFSSEKCNTLTTAMSFDAEE